MRLLRSVQALPHDAGQMLRAASRSPGFFATLIVTLALGIALTTVIVSVVDALLLRPLPFRDADQLVTLGAAQENYSLAGIPIEELPVWTEQRDLFAAVEYYDQRTMDYMSGTEPGLGKATLVSPGMFLTLGAEARLGRVLLPSDAEASAPPTVLLSDAFWRAQFGADPSVIGRNLTLNGTARTIVGVMPPSYTFHLVPPLYWIPMGPPSVERGLISVIARLRTPLAVAQARMYAMAEQLDRDQPLRMSWKTRLLQIGGSRANSDVKTALWVVLAGAACVLLLACANAANLLLVRNVARERELAVRAALGAGRARLTQHLLLESIAVALASGALGVLLAEWMLSALVPLIPSEVTFTAYHTITLDPRVLMAAAVLSLGTGLLFGLLPALHGSARGVGLAGAMVGRSTTASRAAGRLRAGVLTAQLAFAVLLMSGALTFSRSFANLVGVQPGVDVDRLAAVSLQLSSRRYADTASVHQFYDRLRVEVAAIPGVTGVSLAGGVPPHTGFMFGTSVEAEGLAKPEGQPDLVPYAAVDSAYFRVSGTRIVAGRGFDATDAAGAPRVAVIDEDFARWLWHDASPIGRRFRLDADAPWQTVVGVARDAKLMGPDDRMGRYEMYRPQSQNGVTRYGTLLARTDGDPAALLPALRRAVRTVDPEQAITQLDTMGDRFSEAVAKPRFFLLLMLLFGVAALGLATLGIYGTVSFTVAQRTRELAIRIAVGASGWSIKGLVVRQVALVVAAGSLVGLGGAVAASRFVQSVLFGVAPMDVVNALGATAVLALAALAASYLPAARAARVNPIRALNTE